jgi:hypothetical protein
MASGKNDQRRNDQDIPDLREQRRGEMTPSSAKYALTGSSSGSDGVPVTVLPCTE